MRQYELFDGIKGISPESLAEYFNSGSRIPVRMILTHNRVSMVSVKFGPNHIDLRLHEAFLEAPQEVLAGLRKYLRTRRKSAWAPVAAFAQVIEPEERVKPVDALRKKGHVYDLGVIYRYINKKFFNGRVNCSVGWGRQRSSSKRRRRSGRSIRFGSWSPSSRTIRIHPLLDDERVPAVFIDYIMFHEMLHAVVPSHHSGGRRYDHPETFKRLERTFPDLSRMKQIAKHLLKILL